MAGWVAWIGVGLDWGGRVMGEQTRQEPSCIRTHTSFVRQVHPDHGRSNLSPVRV